MRTYKTRWPYLAKAARDCAAEDVAAALNNVLPLSESEENTENLRRIGRVLYHLQNALRHLEGVGAQTRPKL